MMIEKIVLRSAVSLLAMTGAITAAHAQDRETGDVQATSNAQVPARPATQPDAPSVAAPADAGASATTEEEAQAASTGDIVVTANRTSSLASRTPIALTAVTGEGLRDAGITNPTQLADQVPSLSIDRGNGLQITIRGVTSADGSEKGDPSAAFLVDGIYIARPQAQEVSFYDIDRVEVLRGPQGTLYGRNTTAGVVNIITARPRQEFSASVDGTYASYNNIQGTAVLNVPVTDSIAVRGAVNIDRRDSYIEQGSSRFSLDPFKDNLSGRLTALFEFGGRSSLLVRGDYSRQKGGITNLVPLSNFFVSPQGAPAAGQALPDPVYRTGLSSEDRRALGYDAIVGDSRNNRTWGVMAELNIALSDALTLTYLGGYNELKRDESNPYIGGFSAVGNVATQSLNTFTGDYWQNSQELRLSYDQGPLKVQLGGYYFKEHSDIESLFIGLLAPNPGTAGYVFGYPQRTNSSSLAGFGQGTLSVTDKLRVTGGVRYTHDDKSRVGATIRHADLNAPLVFPPDLLNDAARTFSKVTWKAGVDWDVAERTLLYGSVSTGYKAGGFNNGCAVGTPNCLSPVPDSALYYQPETLTAYEVGFKTRMLNNSVRLNGNYFHYDYNDLQLTQLANLCNGPCQVTTNAARATIDGVELEGTLQISPRNRVDLSAAWLDARYASYEIAPGVNLAGRQLDRSPEWTAAVGYTYTYPLANGGSIGAGVRSRVSDSYMILSPVLRSQFRQPSFTKTDLTITYTAPENRWYLQGFVKNIENEVTLSSATIALFYPRLVGGSASFADPRLIGVRGGVSF